MLVEYVLIFYFKDVTSLCMRMNFHVIFLSFKCRRGTSKEFSLRKPKKGRSSPGGGSLSKQTQKAWAPSMSTSYTKFVNFGGEKYPIPWNAKLTPLPRNSRFDGLAKSFSRKPLPTTSNKDLCVLGVPERVAMEVREVFGLSIPPLSISFQLLTKAEDIPVGSANPFAELRQSIQSVDAYMGDFYSTNAIHEQMSEQLKEDLEKLTAEVNFESDEDDSSTRKRKSKSSGKSGSKRRRKSVQPQCIDLRLIQAIGPRDYKSPPISNEKMNIIMIDVIVTILNGNIMHRSNRYLPSPKTPIYVDQFGNDAATTEIIDGKAIFVEKEELDPTTVLSAKMMENEELMLAYLNMKTKQHRFQGNKSKLVMIISNMFDLGVRFNFQSGESGSFNYSNMTPEMKASLGSWYAASVSTLQENEPDDEEESDEEESDEEENDEQEDKPKEEEEQEEEEKEEEEDKPKEEEENEPNDEQEDKPNDDVPPADVSAANRDAAILWYNKAKESDDDLIMEACLKRSLALCATEEARSLMTYLETYGVNSANYANAKRIIDLSHRAMNETARAMEILNLQHGASNQEIKGAWRNLAMQIHPDKNKARNATEAFKIMTQAYHYLSGR